MTGSAPLEFYEIRAIAASAMTDPRTVERVLRGEPVRPSTMARIKRALADRGLLDLITTNQEKSE